MSSHGLRRTLSVLLFVVTVCLVSSLALSQTKATAPSPGAKDADALRTVKNIERPLTFEENQGQFDSKARFVSRGTGYELLLAPNRADISLSKSVPAFDARGHRTTRFDHADTLQLTLEGANPNAAISGQDKLASTSNYYIGNDRTKWREGVPNYSRVRYQAIYPGIDLVYYGNQRRLEHDFIVAPGADPNRIHIGVSGAKSVHLNASGDVVMEVADGSLRLLNPVIYQDINGQRKAVSGRYELVADKSMRFRVGRYDKRHALVIDPVLSYSTYLGGSSSDQGAGVAVNGSTVYITGVTFSSDFIQASGTPPANSNEVTFVVALNLNTGLVYSTYFADLISSYAGIIPIDTQLAVDPSGNAYITGTGFGDLTGTANAYGGNGDAFVAKLSPTGTLAATNYIGGVGREDGYGIAFDPVNSRVLVAGGTTSTDFPVTNSQVPAVGGQLYTSADAGASWSLSNGSGASAIGGMDVKAILIVPSAVAPTSTYYVGGTAGVYTSVDGTKWTAINAGLNGANVFSLANDPSSGALYAGTYNGLYKYSALQGQWNLLTGLPQREPVTAVIVNPTTSAVYASVVQNGFYVSTNGGSTWAAHNTGLAPAYETSLALASNGTLYAVPENTFDNSSSKLYVSTDATNWTAATNNNFPTHYSDSIGAQGYLGHNLLFVDNSSGRVYALYPGGGAVSSDGGNNWTNLGVPATDNAAYNFNWNFNSIVVDPSNSNTLYVGTDDGIYKSTNTGATWTRIDSGFASVSVVALAVDSVASTQLGKTVLYSGAMGGQGFVASLDTNLNLLATTTFGGDGLSTYLQDEPTFAASVAADGQGNIFVAGGTDSSALYLPGSESGARQTPQFGGDGFLLKLNSGTTALWGTYLGGTVGQNIVAVSPDGSPVVGGDANGGGLATTAGAYQATCSTVYCIFFQKYLGSTGAVVFSTYYPGGGLLSPRGLALDSTGNIYFTENFLPTINGTRPIPPMANPLDQPLSNTGTLPGTVAELSSDGKSLVFSTPLAGASRTTGIALDASGAIYVAGYTNSTSFSIAGNAVQTALAGSNDAFLVQITHTGASNDVALQVTPAVAYSQVGNTITFNAKTGDTVTFNFNIQNLTATGNGANNVVLETDFPLTGISIPGAECSTGTPSRCYLGLLLPGTSVSGSATATYAATGSFSNVFVVRTDDDDPNPGNNSATVNATIQAALPPDLQVTVTPATQNADIGGTATFTVNVVNNGLGAATNINLHSTLSVYSGGPFFSNVGSQWFQLLPSGAAPAARESMSAAYDPNNHSMIVFGGYENGRNEVNDVWVLSHADGNGLQTWTELSPTGVPPEPRFGSAIVYDAASNRLIIFGGYSDFTNQAYNDVWVLTNANGKGGTPQWIQLSPSGTPPAARDSAEWIYDPATHTMTVFGGYVNNGGCGTASDVWTLSNADGTTGTPNWTELNPSGTSPLGIAYGTAVYDPVSNRMIVFGGLAGNADTCQDSADLMILTNANGQGGSPEWISPTLGAGFVPSPREGQVAAYDPTNNTMTVFGGYNGSTADETLQLSNANAVSGNPTWAVLQPVGDAGPREFAAAAFDIPTHALIVFGGYNSNSQTETNQVWSLKGSSSTCSFNSAIADATCQLGSLAPGQSTTLGLQALINTASVGDTITFNTSATEDQSDANANDNSGSATITIANPDLGISLTGPTSPIFHGASFPDSFDYTLTVTNNGDNNSGTPTVLVQLDSNLKYVGQNCSPSGSNNLICLMGPLTPGTNESTTISVSASAVGTFTSSAAFYQDGNGNPYADANPANDASGPVSTTLALAADLQLSLSVGYYGTVGAPTVLTAQVYNGGPSDVSNATVTLMLPPQVSIGFGAPCSGTTGTVTCTIGPIQFDFTQSISIPLVANYPGVYTILASAQDTGGSQNPIPSDASGSATVTGLPLLSAASESFVVSLADQGQVAAYYFGAQLYSATAKSGASPGTSAIDPSGRYMYVNAGGFAAYTSVVDFTVQDEVSRIRGIHGRPMILTPDGTRLIARSASRGTDALVVVNTSTQQIIKTISLDGMFGDTVGVADLSFDSAVIANNKLYMQVSSNVPSYGVAVVDLSSFTVKAVTGTDVGAPYFSLSPNTIAAKSDGSLVFALRRTPPEVLVINTSSDAVTTTVPFTNASNLTAIVATRNPADPNGQFAYVAGHSDGYFISTVNLADYSTGNSAGPSFLPTGMVLSADGTTLEAFHLGASNGGNNAGSYPVPAFGSSLEFIINGYLGGVSSGFLYTNNHDAPINNGSGSLAYITDVQPNPIDNSTPNTLSIFGGNFTSDARVRIGHLDPLSSPDVTFVSSGRLDVTLPALVPEQDAKVFVTLPNNQEILTGRNVTTQWTSQSYPYSPQKLGISSAFTLPNALAILRYGDSTLDLVSTSKNGTDLGTLPLPTSLAFSTDGQTAYISAGAQTTGVQALSLATGQSINIPISNDYTGYQDALATGTDTADGRPVLYFNSSDGQGNNQLFIVDADSTAQTFNTVKRTINAGDLTYSQGSGALAASGDGRYVYTFADVYQSGAFVRTDLIAYDITNGTAAIVQDVNKTFGAEQIIPNHLRVSPDGNWLVMPGQDGSVKAVNIGTDPSLVTPPTIANVVTFGDGTHSFKTFQVVGSRLFAFDATTNTLTAFNFQPTTNTFGKLGSVTLPGPGSLYESPLLVDPTGATVYLALKDQDAIAILDANKVAASDPTALLDVGGNERGMEAIALQPSVTPEVNVSVAFNSSAYTYTTGAPSYLYATISDVGAFDAHQVVATVSDAVGVNFTSVTWSSSDASGSCQVSGATATCTIAKLSAGDSASLTVIFDTPSQTPTAYAINLTSTQETNIGQTTSGSTTLTSNPGADLAVSSDFGIGGPLVAGATSNYSITISNLGPNNNIGGTLYLTLPGLNITSWSTTAGIGCSPSQSYALQCGFESLTANSSYLISITGTVPASKSAQLYAYLSANYDPNYSNNYVSTTVNVTSSGTSTIDNFLVPDINYGFVRGANPSNVNPLSQVTYAGINPVGALALPGGRTAFVASQNANYISVVDLGSQQEIYRIQNEVVRTAALTSDASQLLVARRTDPTKLDVFDTTTFALVNTITLTGLSAPENIFVASGKAFLLTKNAGPIAVVDLSTGVTSTLSGTSTYGNSNSTRFGLTGDGSTLVAVGGGDANTPATVFLINPSNNTVIQSIPLPINTTKLTVAVTPVADTSNFAYITTDNTLQTLDVSTADPNYGTFVQGATATLPLTPTSAAITSDGVTLGYTQSTPNVSPNIISMPTSSVLTGASVSQYTFGNYVGIITDSQADFLPSVNAPQITTLSPDTIVNNASNILQINGSNFSSDAVVKIGNDNPIIPTSVSPDGTQLTVTLPPFTPSGYPHVVVINRNAQDPSIANRNVPSNTTATLYVLDGPAFNQNYDTFVLNYGNSSILSSGSSQSALQGSSSNLINVANPSSVVVDSNDQWFVGSTVQPIGNVTQGISSTYYGVTTQQVPLTGNIALADSLALVTDPTSGRNVVLVPSTTTTDNVNYDWQLNVVDADPYSPTYDKVLRWIPAGTSNATIASAGFAATPDGKFAYQQVALNNSTAELVIYDVTNNTATIRTGLGIDPLAHTMQVSPDGKYLAIANPTPYNVQVFSIANKTSPSLTGTIALTRPSGVMLTHCCNIRIANNFLYAYDPGAMQVQAFSFQPPNFSAAGMLQLTGTPDYFFAGGLAVTPDGANLYVAELNNDVVDVIDTTQFGSGDINQALITRLASQGNGPVSIALNGAPTAQSFADLSVSVSHLPEPATLGGTLTYTIAVTNLGPDQSGNAVITDTLPSGFALSSYTFDTGDVFCSGTNVVTCTLGTLSANQTSTVNLTVSTAGVSTVGPYTSTVTVGQVGQTVPDPMTANNTASDIANLADPDITISASADTQNPAVGATVNFTVNVVNNGLVPATGTTVSGSITAGNITNANGCTTTATTFSCPVGQLAANGGSAGVTIAATMPGTAGSVVFNASVSENETDGNPQDNTLTPPITIAVGGGADLVLAPAGSPVNVNGLPTYTVVVTNNGPDAAQDVTIKDTLSGFGFVSAVSSAGSCSFNGGTVFCSVGNLAVGASATANISVTAPPSGWASNEFHASSDTFDPVPTNNAVNMGPFGGSIGNTTAGPNVLVDALDPTSGMAANFLFSNISKPGLTRVTSTTGTQPPTGYRFGTPALIYDLSTSALYSGQIRVALRLSGVTFHHPNAIRLFHFENGAWVDRTMALDAAHGMITGVTSSLSPFAIVEPLNSVPVANAGTDQVIPGASQNGASVTLNGGASTDADGDPLTYTWTGSFPEGNGTVTGANPKVTLPLGVSKLTLVVNDGEASSTPAAVNVTVSDFLIAAPTTAISLARGQSTSFNVVLTPKFGAFDDPVSVACGNVPAGLTCAVQDNSVTPGAQGTSVTVTLTASASAGLHNNSGPLFAFWMGGLPVFGVLLTGKFKRNRRSMLILLAIVVLLVVGMVACGGAGSNSVSQPPPPSSSTTSVTVTGTSGDLQHSSTATVTIQH